MKKIMFNDKYGLTQAVLEGRKTMTRRIVQDDVIERYDDPWDLIGNCARYHFDEVVAIAQSYNDAEYLANKPWTNKDFLKSAAGWNNKMFVRADFMPHHIEITDIKTEKLQDISDDDCLKEGIEEFAGGYGVKFGDNHNLFSNTPRTAFAALIDKVSGKGTWKKNPWVFAYSFELID